ncbi:MAG: uL14 family ribosomal protein [Slackia sp.]
MIQMQTMLNVADNSALARCSASKFSAAPSAVTRNLGDVIICSVKGSRSNGNVKKGDVVRCVIVRVKRVRRNDGSYIRFDQNAAVPDRQRRCSLRALVSLALWPASFATSYMKMRVSGT